MTEYTFIVFLAVIIGILAGFGAILFRAAIAVMSDFFFPGDKTLLDNIIAAPFYVRLLVPALGGIIISFIAYFMKKDAEGHGVVEVMESLITRGGTIQARSTLVKAIVSAITIGTGGSVGREGPVISIGAGIGSIVGRFFRMSSNQLKTLVGCGAAAGLAAAFNVPIAGALFAVEILLRDFTFTQFSPIVISSVIATVISHKFEGNYAAFQVPSYQLVSDYELIFYIILGLLCAVISFFFIKTLYFSEHYFKNKLAIPDYIKPTIGGLSVGAIAVFFPEVMGVGYDTVYSALHNDFVWQAAVMLIFAKIVATSITLGSGESGGVFVPTLFIGAMLGYSYGYFIQLYFPGISSSPGAYALVAMGGLIAGTMHAPITSIIIVFELTYDYQIILPLMITCIISMLLSSKFSRESIFTLSLLQRNIHLKNGAEINMMKSIYVRDIYSRRVDTIQESSGFNEIVDKIITAKSPLFPVANKENEFIGIITIYNIKEYLYDKEALKDIIIAGDIAEKNIAPVTLDDDCQIVMDRLAVYNLDGIPVVEEKTNRLLGVIWRRDIYDVYNKELENRDIVTSFADRITINNIDRIVHFMEGGAITEIPVPSKFVGKSIKELDIRVRHGVDILLIRSNTEKGSMVKTLPRADYRFTYSDSLVISGEVGKINLIKNI